MTTQSPLSEFKELRVGSSAWLPSTLQASDSGIGLPLDGGQALTQSQRASVDGGPAGAEDCAGLGTVGSEVRIRVQGATTSLAMTRVKHNSQSWVGVVVGGNGGQRRKLDVVVG